MFKQTIDTLATPHVTITECLGNLVVRGSEEKRVTVNARSRADQVTLEQEGKTFTLASSTDCFLTCPTNTTLTVHTVQGNLKIEGVEGPITIGIAHGNTSLRAIGPVALEQVFGNLSVRQAAGSLSAQIVRGNTHIRQVEGSLSLGRVDGNLAAEGIQGDLTTDRVQGNARLRPPFPVGAARRLNVSGNLTVRLPTNANLNLALRADGGVRSRIPGLDLEDVEGETRGIMGSGEASLEARVGGHISLRPAELDSDLTDDLPFDFAPDMERLGMQIEASIAEAMTEMETRLEESLSRIDNQQLHLRVEQAAENAHQKTEKVRRKAEHEAEKARMRAERAERRWQRASGQRSRSKREPATDEERMRVLRLVEEGRLAPEQASDLLAALEGR